MRFPPRTPCNHLQRTLLPALLSLVTFLAPEAGRADDFDLTLQGSDMPVGALSGQADVGPVALALRHSEYLAYLNQGYREESGDENPLIRRTEIDGTGFLGAADLGLEGDAGLPLGLALTIDEWESGDREVRITGRSGVRFGELRFDHSLTLATRLAADGTQTRFSNGRLSLGGGFLGGIQEGVLEYDAQPLAQITRLGLQSDWHFEDGGSLLTAFDHRPLEGVSEARFGLRQAVGPFDMTSDFMADSTGAYSLGVSFSLNLGAKPKDDTWRLSSMLAGLRAERRPPATPVPRSFMDAD